MVKSEKIRLDQLLVDRYGYESRSRARDAILRGCVSVDGRTVTKPGLALADTAPITISDEAGSYVSRAALKLVAALEAEGIEVLGKTCLDLGASTGGFSQVLLEAGAAKVFAVDVGSAQMHPSLVDEPRLVNIENLNARALEASHLDGQQPEILVSDLSFISLKLALPPALALAAPGATGIFLVKPQFEVGRDRLGSGGIVRDEALVEATATDLGQWIDQQPGWRLLRLLPSPIKGGDGNREFLMIAKKDRVNGRT